jgi:N-methylhydantoinase B
MSRRGEQGGASTESGGRPAAARPAPGFDPLRVEVWRHLLASIAEEMGATLERTAYSPNIKERLDSSCALFDHRGRLLAQAAHIPVHLGAMPSMLRSLRTLIRWRAGDMWVCNHPLFGGTHLPDLTLVAPVFTQTGRRSLIGFVANRAHHSDIGGISPGSLPLSTELFHEGLVLPPLRLVSAGKPDDTLIDLIGANSRTPDERRGDIAAQIAANEIGIGRLQALACRGGLPELRTRALETIAYAERCVRATLRRLPPGDYEAVDLLDDDGAGTRDIRIAVRVTVRADGTIRFDFTGSAPQVPGSLNATEAITLSACMYVVRCLVADDIPTNEGCFAPVEVVAPEGSIVNARFPAAVAGGNVETSQRIVDVALRALASAAPDRIPAASQGTMNNLTIGGWDPFRNRPFSYYETLAGGAGAGPAGDGLSAVHTHMTNTRNTPIESIESHYPLRVLEYAVAEGTGGGGKFSGGDGIVRRIELLADAHVSLLSERRAHGPYGLDGGEEGRPGFDTIQLPGEPERPIAGKWSGRCPAGTIVTVRTPGGGGFGSRDRG